MHKSSIHMARTSSTIFTYKKNHPWKHCKTQIQTQPNKFLTAYKAIKTGSVPQKVNHPHKRTSGQSIANHVGPHCPLSIFIPHNQDYEAMFKDQKNCHKETCHAQVTSQAHTWRVPVAPLLHLKTASLEAFKNTNSNTTKQVSQNGKQSRLAQFLRRLTTLTSVLQDKALRIMLVLTALYPT